ncbi:MAG: hypothetical protein HDQ87_04265 [Clostridia bacterium]|nr:hypothetical protein [Clostridia bacterium]
MSSISGISAAQSAPAAASGVHRSENPAPGEQNAVREKPAEFRHETPQSPGRYWLEAGAAGASLRFEPPTTSAASAEKQIEASPAPEVESGPRRQAAGDPDNVPTKEARPEREESLMRCSTDDVDREIEQLRSRVQMLERQAAGQAEDDAGRELEAAKRELEMKDNDAYRRQHAQFTDLG